VTAGGEGSTCWVLQGELRRVLERRLRGLWITKLDETGVGVRQYRSITLSGGVYGQCRGLLREGKTVLSTGDSKAGLDGGGDLLEVEGLSVEFPVRGGLLQRVTERRRVVDGVSFRIGRGEALGLVGESGCGKTTVGRAVLRLIPAAEGRVRFGGRDVLAMGGGELTAWRRSAQMIFQDPGGSLNPRMRIAEILEEPYAVHRLCSAQEARQRILGLLDRCGLTKASLERYPHEFSGGQKQRIAIARALALEPALLVCDEPTSALDVSIQAQILNLLKELQAERGLSYLFISHDLAVVGHLCQRVAVMNAGQIVEAGTVDEVLGSPREEYTKALLRAVPGQRMAAVG
jgi:peptide/nickel transport system ATP-binding protein